MKINAAAVLVPINYHLQEVSRRVIAVRKRFILHVLKVLYTKRVGEP